MKRLLFWIIVGIVGANPGVCEGQANNYNAGSDPNVSKAESSEIEKLRQKAEEGDADAQFNLGIMYDNGKGVEQDYKEAVKWFRKVAEQGYADGQFGLGVMYAEGQGVEQDYKEAVKWFREAAEQGDAKAQYNLGVTNQYMV